MDYVLHVDRHEPFRTEAARWILDTVQPDYLVHEFLQHSRVDLDQKMRTQRFALGYL